METNFSKELKSQNTLISYLENSFINKFKQANVWLVDYNFEIDDFSDGNENFIDNLKHAVNEQLVYWKSLNKVDEKPYPDGMHNIDGRSDEGQLIDYCYEYCCTEDIDVLNYSTDDVNKFREYTIHMYREYKRGIIESKEFETVCDQDWIEEYDNLYSKTNYSDIFEYLKIYQINQKINYTNRNIDNATYDLEDIKERMFIFDTKNHSNIYRQSFINLNTIFECYVFDTLKKFFSYNINELSEYVEANKLQTLDYNELIITSDMNSLHEKIINKNFEGFYISSVIKKLYKYDKGLFDDVVKKERILEIINRRNIHVHNMGKADFKYINGYNLDRLQMNDYVPITKKYFIDSLMILEKLCSRLDAKYNVKKT